MPRYAWTYRDQYGNELEGSIYADNLTHASEYARRFIKLRGPLRDFTVKEIADP